MVAASWRWPLCDEVVNIPFTCYALSTLPPWQRGFVFVIRTCPVSREACELWYPNNNNTVSMSIVYAPGKYGRSIRRESGARATANMKLSRVASRLSITAIEMIRRTLLSSAENRLVPVALCQHLPTRAGHVGTAFALPNEPIACRITASTRHMARRFSFISSVVEGAGKCLAGRVSFLIERSSRIAIYISTYLWTISQPSGATIFTPPSCVRNGSSRSERLAANRLDPLADLGEHVST